MTDDEHSQSNLPATSSAEDEPVEGVAPVATVPPAPDTAEAANELFPADAEAAYLLDALTADEQAAFIAYLEQHPERLDHLQELATIAALLPEMFEGLDLPEVVTTGYSPSLAALAEDDSDAAQAAAIEAAVAKPSRIQGRIRGGVSTGPTDARQLLATLRGPGLVALGAGIVALIAILWGLAQVSRIGDLQREIRAQNVELADLRLRGNATAYTLAPVGGSQTAGSGTFYYATGLQQGVLFVRGLAPLAEGRVYQLWLVDQASGQVTAGPTFTVGDTGEQTILVQASSSFIVQAGISEEPFGGSVQPTSPFLLAASLQTDSP